MKSLPYASLALLLYLSSCVKIGGDSESRYETHDSFKKRWENIANYLPDSASDIRHYAVLDFDTNYHFLEASVDIHGLQDFITSKNDFNCQSTHAEIFYSDRQFDSLFYKRPVWWNQESMFYYDEKYLCLFTDANGYGKGCMLFYDNHAGNIRVFVWSQQWLRAEDVKKKMLSEAYLTSRREKPASLTNSQLSIENRCSRQYGLADKESRFW